MLESSILTISVNLQLKDGRLSMKSPCQKPAPVPTAEPEKAKGKEGEDKRKRPLEFGILVGALANEAK